MIELLRTLGRALFAGVCLFAPLVACDADLDPCSEERENPPSRPVGCGGTSKPRLLAHVPLLSSDFTGEVAASSRTVALDDTFAYWSDYTGRILRTPKTGGDTVVLLPANDCSIAALAVDDLSIYFGQNCKVPELRGSFPVLAKVSWLHKATGERHELAQQQHSQVTQIAVLDGTVYWNLASIGDPFTPDLSILHGAPRDTGLPFDDSLIGTGAPFRPFVAGVHGIVWLDVSRHVVRLSPLIGGYGDELAPAPEAESLFVQGEMAYWIQRSILPIGALERKLWQVPLAGGAPTLAFDGLVSEHVVPDGADFYGFGFNTPTTQVQYRIYRWSPPAFEPVALAAGFGRPHSIALDASHIFVIDEAGNWDHVELRLLRIDR